MGAWRPRGAEESVQHCETREEGIQAHSYPLPRDEWQSSLKVKHAGVPWQRTNREGVCLDTEENSARPGASPVLHMHILVESWCKMSKNRIKT